MNERLRERLDAARRTASRAGGSAAGAACGVGRRAGELLSVTRRNIQVMSLNREADAALREVGEMLYATHTGHPTDSETLLAKLREIDALRGKIRRLEQEIARLQSGAACPSCGAPAQRGDVFCRECGGKL